MNKKNPINPENPVYKYNNLNESIQSVVPIRGFMKGTGKFPIQKCAIFRKFKEIGGIARRHTAACRTSDSAD